MNESPLKDFKIQSFEMLKNDLLKASVQAIHKNIPFTVEIDASDFAIAITLKSCLSLLFIPKK